MATPVIYPPADRFPIGGSRTLRASKHDRVTLLAAGITVHEALAAADLLASIGIHARVIDLYSVKPLDTATVIQAALETGNLVIAEDHWAQGGRGDAVLEALADADSDARYAGSPCTRCRPPDAPRFLGMAAGVGKTYRMLQEGQARLRTGATS
jgi:transketolase